MISGLDDASPVKFDIRAIGDPIARCYAEARAAELAAGYAAALGGWAALPADARCAVQRAAQAQSLVTYAKVRLKFMTPRSRKRHARAFARLKATADEAVGRLALPANVEVAA